jgi:hypothetical protein
MQFNFLICAGCPYKRTIICNYDTKKNGLTETVSVFDMV